MSAATTLDLERTATTSVDWLPGYDLLGSLGAGSFGTVFKALQHQLQRVVAVKVITVDEDAHPNMAARFEAEALTHGQLHHTNIVQIYDRGRHEDRLFIAMELLEGEDLSHRLKHFGPLPPRVAWAIVRQTASALAHAQQHGVIHRDIKPANLFLVPAPSGLGLPRDVPLVKVTDFGLALTKQASENSDARLTAEGIILGTPVYMAPEQYRHAPDLDHRADIYSLGATVAHMLGGMPPFEGPSIWEVIAQKMDRGPKLAETIPDSSRKLILEMMATESNDRPAGYAELIAKIDALELNEPAPSKPKQETSFRARNLIVAAALLFVLLAPILFKPIRAANADLPMPAEEYITTGEHYSLIGDDSNPWLPPVSGGIWLPGEDAEGDAVLAGTGFTRKQFERFENYRLALGVDLSEATAFEVHFAIPAVAPEKALRLVMRISRNGGAGLGTRNGDKGTWAVLENTESAAFPSPAWFEGRRGYLEVRVQRAGGVWTAWFNNQCLGSVNDDNTTKCSELRLYAEGGRARVNSVELTPLKRD